MESELKKVTSWFLFIGILSIVNSLVWWFELANLHFVVGLGITQFVDGFIFGMLKNSGMVIALLINIVVSGFFILTTFLTNKGFKTIYYVALVVYILDALLLLYFSDFFSFGFHILALFFLLKGINLIRLREEYAIVQTNSNQEVM